MSESITKNIVPIDPYWAIEEGWAFSALDRMNDPLVIRDHADMVARSGDEDQERKPYRVDKGIAVISVAGPMTKHQTSMSYFFGGTSTVMARRAIRAAVADPDVKGILLHVDSPGGQVSGTSDLADDIAAANRRKPVNCYIEDLGASAAYWLASQCDKVYANSTGLVGSIGVYTVAYDSSQRYKDAGVKVHVIRAGQHKGALEPGTEFTPEQMAEVQRRVDAFHSAFVDAVAKGRKMDRAKALALADGRIHIAKEALSLGLIDGIKTLDAAIHQMSTGISPGSTALGGEPTTGDPMEQKKTFMQKLTEFFAGEGINIDAAGGGSTPPAAADSTTPPAGPSNSAAADAKIASLEAELAAMRRKDADKAREAFVSLAIKEGHALPSQGKALGAIWDSCATSGTTIQLAEFVNEIPSHGLGKEAIQTTDGEKPGVFALTVATDDDIKADADKAEARVRKNAQGAK